MFHKAFSRLHERLFSPVFRRIARIPSEVSVVEQKNLAATYRGLYQSDSRPLAFKDVGFRVHSQHEEDGILLYLFSLIGTTNKKCVEMCAGNGMECNTANLIVNHRWIGLLFDGKKENVRKAKRFYSRNPDTRFWPPAVVHEWITRENVNRLVEGHFQGEIDLLSLDVDGVDYWLWKDLTCISPRVVVLEFNHLWGPDVSVSVPYRDDFTAGFTRHGSDYAGASLRAFVNLGKEKGYRLVGTNAIATNAFFVRNDIDCSWFPEIDPSECFEHPRARFGMEKRLPGVRDKEWVEV